MKSTFKKNCILKINKPFFKLRNHYLIKSLKVPFIGNINPDNSTFSNYITELALIKNENTE